MAISPHWTFSVQLGCTSNLQPQVDLFLLHLKWWPIFLGHCRVTSWTLKSVVYSGVVFCNFSHIILCLNKWERISLSNFGEKNWRNIFLLSYEYQNNCMFFLFKKIEQWSGIYACTYILVHMFMWISKFVYKSHSGPIVLSGVLF